MARIRTIKPEFFTSEDIVALSPLARLLYVALWCEADRDGRMAWKPRTFKIRYLPADDCDIESLCREIVSAGLVVLYGDGLAYIPAFAKHQHINPREAVSIFPEPDACPTRAPRVADASPPVTDAQVGRERKGKEGKDYVDPKGSTSPDADASEPSARVPFKEIVAVYHEILPELPRCEVLTDARRGQLRQRWVEHLPELDHWRNFFTHVRGSRFLMGLSPPRGDQAPFRADLEWLTKAGNFAKIAEGKYHR